MSRDCTPACFLVAAGSACVGAVAAAVALPGRRFVPRGEGRRAGSGEKVGVEPTSAQALGQPGQLLVDDRRVELGEDRARLWRTRSAGHDRPALPGRRGGAVAL